MKKGIIAVILGVLGIFAITKVAKGGQCYLVDNIGIGPLEPYHYAIYLGSSMSILDAFGATNDDIFTVEFLIEGIYQRMTPDDIIPNGQKFRFQVVRTTEICHISLEQ